MAKDIRKKYIFLPIFSFLVSCVYKKVVVRAISWYLHTLKLYSKKFCLICLLALVGSQERCNDFNQRRPRCKNRRIGHVHSNPKFNNTTYVQLWPARRILLPLLLRIMSAQSFAVPFSNTLAELTAVAECAFREPFKAMRRCIRCYYLGDSFDSAVDH